MSGGSSGSEVLNGVPLMRHVELGMGTMLEEPQASEPGPTWTPSEIWFDCMGQAHYTCESRQDLIMPGLVWSGYKVWQVCFLYEAGPTDWSSSIHSHSRQEQGRMIGFLASAASVIATTGYEGSPQNGSLLRNNGRKKAKAKGPAIDKSRWSAEGFWKTRQTVLAHLVGGIVGYYGVYKQRNGNQPPPWQAGRRRPNRWERLGVAENGLGI